MKTQSSRELAMKGKERSPAKAKRSRGAEESTRERGAKKLSSGGGSNGSSGKTSESSTGRRSLHVEKSISSSRDYEQSGRTQGLHRYGSPGASSGSGSSKGGAESRGGRAAESRAEPEYYKSLRISELGSSLSDEAIEDGLFHEFKKFGDVSVKMSREGDERVALVNFRRALDARAAKHARGRLVLYDRPLKIEAVYLNVGGTNRRRSRSPGDKDSYGGLSAAVSTLATHRHPHGQRALSPGGLGYRDYRLQQLALGRLPPAPATLPRELDRERDYSLYESRLRPTYTVDPRVNFRDEDLALEIDARANRTLFVGNLDVIVKETEIYRVFGRFGTITEVDIKRAGRGQQTTYGFIKFENLDMAHRAKVAMSGKMLRSYALKIGYGKVVPTNRLWVGGLGPWVPVTALAREFDRFGTIRQIDYRKGENWAYIQYESLDAAQAACTQMRGFPLGGDHRRLRVDFAEADVRFPHPYVQPLPIPYIDFGEETPGHRTSEASRARDRSPLIFRERDTFTNNEWVSPPARDRHRVTSDSLETIERRADSWAPDRGRERDEVNRNPQRKRRLDDSRRLERSPESDRSRKRTCATPERSPEGSGGRDSRYNVSDRAACRSPSRNWRGSLELGQEDKNSRKNSVEKERKHRVTACKSPLKKDEHPEGNSKVKSPQKTEAAHKLRLAWQGMLLLKNSNFPSNMHLLQGDFAVASSLLVEGPSGGKVAQLKITQRLRLDQPKLDEVTRRIRVAGPNGYAILLAIPATSEGSLVDQASATQRPLRNLVSYLKQKQAAGVISLPVGSNKDKDHAGVLHAFPPCNFSQQFVDAEAKALVKSDEDYLIMIIVRGAS